MGVITALELVTLLINSENWFAIAIIMGAVFPATYITHELALRSYMPELVSDLVEQNQRPGFGVDHPHGSLERKLQHFFEVVGRVDQLHDLGQRVRPPAFTL